MTETKSISVNRWQKEGRNDAVIRTEKWEPLYGWSNKENENAYTKGWGEAKLLKLLEGNTNDNNGPTNKKTKGSI